MKKILIAVAMCATLVSCGGGNSHYFAGVENRTYNDSSAEFDTLAYAMGMNYSLNLKLRLSELNMDFDLYAQTMAETMEKGFTSFEDMEAQQKAFMELQSERFADFNMAMRKRQMGMDTVALPNVYDETFTNKDFTRMMAKLNALDLLTHSVPMNIHYTAEAIRDVKGVEADSLIDKTLRISQKTAMQTLRGYELQIKKNLEAQSIDWLKEIATKPNVDTLKVGNSLVYYRINSVGGVKPEPKDSVQIYYDLYSFRGRLLGSSDAQIKGMKENIERISKDEKLSDSMRQARIDMMNSHIERIQKQKTTLDRIFLPVFKECLPLIGEYGSITIWAPAHLAPQSRTILPGEAVVIDLQLTSVTKGVDLPQVNNPAAPQGKGHSIMITPQNGPKKDNAAKVNPGKPVNPKDASPKSVPAVKSVKVDPAKPAAKK